MASAIEGMDDLIACLVGMGFEIEDCQEAVQCGKLSVEEAVEWILQGKPKVGGQSVLKLGQDTGNRSIGANPFVPSTPPDVDMGAAVTQPIEMDSQVVSRLHMNEEQRQLKERFEAKMRDETRKKLHDDRVAEKKAKVEILKQIAEDRESQKLKREGGATSGGDGASARSVDITSTQSHPVSPPNMTHLQIRLANGNVIRRDFSPSCSLREVYVAIREMCRELDHICLIQPFPRREFTEEHMNTSLQDLGLVPSGSLVVKKPDTDPTGFASTGQPIVAQPIETDPGWDDESHDQDQPMASHLPGPPIAPHFPSQPMAMQSPILSHSWGTGMRLGDDDDAGGRAPLEGELLGTDDEEEYVPMDVWEDDTGQEWGEQIPPRASAQLAAEAAESRFQAMPAAPSSSASVGVHHQVSALTPLVIKHIVKRLCDSRLPLLGLGGIPTDVAMKVLEHLIKERLLRPKTLHPFHSCRLKKLILDCYPYATNDLLTATRLHTYLTHLSLRSCSLITDNGLQALTTLKRLKILNLGSCSQLTNHCLQTIQEFRCLVTLILDDTKVTDQGIIHYLQTCPPELQNLNLNRTAVTHNTIAALAGVPKLRILSVEHSRFSALTGIQGLTSLQSLNIAGTLMPTDSLLCLAGHPNLTSLSIANMPNVQSDVALSYLKGLKLQLIHLPDRLTTTDSGLHGIADMPIQSLDLTNYIMVGNPGLEHIGRIHGLRKLLLGNTKVSDAGMYFLEGLSSLVVLDLDKTAITDLGAMVLKGFHHLQELSLSQTNVTNKFLKDGALSNCDKLTKLNLSKTRVSNKGVCCLSLPNLVHLNLDSTRVRLDVTEILRTSCPHLQNVIITNVVPARKESEDEDA